MSILLTIDNKLDIKYNKTNKYIIIQRFVTFRTILFFKFIFTERTKAYISVFFTNTNDLLFVKAFHKTTFTIKTHKVSLQISYELDRKKLTG